MSQSGSGNGIMLVIAAVGLFVAFIAGDLFGFYTTPISGPIADMIMDTVGGQEFALGDG